MGEVCGVDGLARAVQRIKREYGVEVEEQLKEELIYAGEYCAGQAAKMSLKRTGGYSHGWDFRFKAKRGELTVEVGNRTKYMLAHLLEKGYMNWRGVWVGGREHIEPAFDDTVELLDRRLHG